MFRFLSIAVAVLFVLPCFALPVVVQIKNEQKRNLELHSGKEKILRIEPGQSTEIIVVGKSNYRLRYAPGNLKGAIIWGLDTPLDSAVSECLVGNQENFASLEICSYVFRKQNGTYKLELKDRHMTTVSQADFLGTLSDLRTDPKSPKDEIAQKRRDSVAQMLENYKVLTSLSRALQFRHRVLPGLAQKNSQTQNFLIFGDQGTGDQKAQMVAKDMNAYCDIKKCDDALVLGDNIYPKAPAISTQGWERSFVDKFVTIYKPLWNQFHFPFFTTLGNHDIGVDALFDTDWVYFQRFRKPLTPEHYLTQRVARIDAQTAFTKSTENPVTAEGIRMWNMPAQKYFENLTSNGIKSFVATINTNYFPGEIGAQGESPSSNDQEEVQSIWLQETLSTDAAQNADWRIVFGHHPIFSIGRHGVNTGKLGFAANDVQDMTDLRTALLPILCKNKVDFYLAGHDHHLQVDQIACPKGPNEGHKVVQIISGAAAKKDAESPWGEYVPGSSNAFSEKALYPEFIWANGLNAADLRAHKKARRLLGFAFLSLAKRQAQVEMVESTQGGPRLLACYKFDHQSRVAAQCDVDDDITPLFLRDTDMNIVPGLMK